LSLYNKLSSVQLKNLTSAELMKLGQLTFVQSKSITDLNQLKNIQAHAENLVTPGSDVYADSLKLSAQVINADLGAYKPSTIYDAEPFANTYLVQLLAVSATTTGGDTGTVSIGITDGATSLTLLKPTTVTASGPLTFEPTTPIYVNESNYLSIVNTASVNATCTVYCAIVARGGAE